MREPGTDKPAASPRRARRRSRFLWAFALAAAIVAALQVHAYLAEPEPPAASSMSPAPPPWDASRAEAPTTRQWDLALSPEGPAPEAVAGLAVAEEDPADVALPDGAERQWGFQRRTPAGREQIARYRWEGDLPDAAGHFRNTMVEAGFRMLSEDASDGYKLRMLKGNCRVAVTLRKSRQDGKMVEITVTSLRWP